MSISTCRLSPLPRAAPPAARSVDVAALRESEHRFHSIFDSAFQFIGLLAADGTLLEVNRTALDFACVRAEEVKGRPFWETVWWAHSEEARRRLRDAVARAAAGELVRFEAEHHGPGGRRVVVDFSLKPAREPGGQITHLVAEGRDVTDRVRAEEAVERQREVLEDLLARERAARAAAERAVRVRDEVLGIVSHDLRNPLSTIAMSAAALAEGDGGNRAALADVIARSSGWALRIIRDLLDVTAIEAGRLPIHREPMTVQAITDLVESVFAPQAAEAGVAFAVERRGGAYAPPRWVEADVDRLVQAVGNLVANAIRYTPRGGRVSVAVSGDDAGGVRFRVEDTGPGIAPEHLPRLFDRFWQARETRRGGAGLGLAIAKGIAEGHGGRVEVESTPGRGSAFTLIVPARP